MLAVVLAAGEGRRLRPLTNNMSKVMIPVGGKPILEYVVDSLRENNITEIIMVVGYREDVVRQYFGDGKDFGVKIRYVRQKNQLGIAHAILQAEKYVKEDFLLVYGDNMIERECIKALISTEPNTILATYSDKANRYGVVEMEGPKLVKIREKPNSQENIIFTGMAHLAPEVFERIRDLSEGGKYHFPTVLNSMDIRVKVVRCGWMDAIYPWDLLDLNARALKSVGKVLGGKIEDSTIIGNVEIGEGTVIRAGVYIRGNVKIGENCEIGPNSVIIGDTTIGDGVSIGAMSYIENSIIMEDSAIGEGSIVKDSIIGMSVEAEPRLTTLTGKFEKIMEGEIISGKGGGVIGDGSTIGAGVVIHPGVLIGSDVNIADMKVIQKDVCQGERVI